MQLFLRTLQAGTATLDVDPAADICALKSAIQAKAGVPATDQVLLCGGRLLSEDTTLAAAGVGPHATVTLSSRLRGGKPVKVKMMTNHLPCGPEVTIDIEKDATKDEIKAKLAAVTGVPPQHQKVMLSGINQIAMGDKRTNVGFSSCGTTNGVQLAVSK